ncbi:RtcB family protein [candidate division KSB1 bacterium]|nr:MAG: RtcB family protein [candidate division KSB1 bacterium]
MPSDHVSFEQIGPFRYRIRRSGRSDMRTDGIMFLNEALAKKLEVDESPKQVANVATLPGIVGNSLAMPDMHWGYGFPIGGVAAFDVNEGVISPGGVGYDINCGVSLTRTAFHLNEVKPKLAQLVNRFFERIPTGVGSHGALKVSKSDFEQVIVNGANWAVKQGLIPEADRLHMEDEGCLDGADPDAVSDRARERGFDQIGTLGAGNHFVELQVVEQIFDEKTAAAFGLFLGQICIMVHSGSRGFGYQVCTEYLPVMDKAANKYGISLPDRQLACAPVGSNEGKRYFAAMKCAANYAWVNRLVMKHHAAKVMVEVMQASEERCGIRLVYDVCHNIAKIEEHLVDGKLRRVCVHRKGATRSLPADHPLVPEAYRHVGQPVLIPGDMGRASYVLVGAETALAESFGSAPHGAGRLMSRHQGLKLMRGDDVRAKLAEQGIIVQARSKATLAEEQPDVYKDVEEVVKVAAGAGLAKPVARLKPLGAIKG